MVVWEYPFGIFNNNIAKLNQSRVRSKGVRLVWVAWVEIAHFGMNLHFSEVLIYRGKWLRLRLGASSEKSLKRKPRRQISTNQRLSLIGEESCEI